MATNGPAPRTGSEPTLPPPEPPRHRPPLLAAVVAVGALTALVALVLVVNRDADEVTTATAPTLETALDDARDTPDTAPTVPPTGAPGPTSTLPTASEGTRVSASGALLAVAPAPTVQSIEPSTADCTKLGDPGWTVQCGKVDMVGGRRAWLVEQRHSGGLLEWRTRVVSWSEDKGAWLIDLAYPAADDNPAAPGSREFAAVTVKGADLTGDGKAELVFGFRSSGSGAILAYDVVTDHGDAPARVVASRDLAHGQASIANGLITDYAAQYPNNEPNCCPAYVQESTVYWSRDGFRAVAGERVQNTPRGDFT
jgi:hypothetical protein